MAHELARLVWLDQVQEDSATTKYVACFKLKQNRIIVRFKVRKRVLQRLARIVLVRDAHEVADIAPHVRVVFLFFVSK